MKNLNVNELGSGDSSEGSLANCLCLSLLCYIPILEMEIYTPREYISITTLKK